MRLPSNFWRPLLCGGAWSVLAVPALRASGPGPGAMPPETAPAPPPVALREAWVPATGLKPVLDHYPRAVPLRLDQLLALLHDARAADPAGVDPAQAPPVRAALREALFDAHPAKGPEGMSSTPVQVAGDLVVESFSDGWSEVPVGLANVSLGTAVLDDGNPSASLRRRGEKADAPVALLFRGRGQHRLHVDFLLPVETKADGSRIALPRVDGAAEFALHLPANSRVTSSRGCAVQAEETSGGVVARVSLQGTGTGPDADFLSWHAAVPVPDEATNLRQDCQLTYRIEAATITAQLRLKVVPLLGRLPGGVRLPLPPGAHAVRVEGNPMARWDLATDGLHVDFAPTEPGREPEDFTVFYELPLALDPAGVVANLALPLPEIAGAYSVVGQIALRRGDGVQLQRVQTAPFATSGARLFDEKTESSQDFVGGYTIADLPAKGNAAPAVALTVEARRTRTRFSVDADAQASFRPAIVDIVRNLNFHAEEGTLFSARIMVPKGETFVDLVGANPEADWRRDGDTLFVTWPTGVSEGGQALVQVTTREEPAAPTIDTPTPFAFDAIKVPGAERLTGYIALNPNAALRVVTTDGDERLERRNGQSVPVHGTVAWFYRDDYHLTLRVERRAAEIEARFTGYARPQMGVVEIHGQIDYQFLLSGVETVKIRVPRESANAFFFTGPRIAERRLDGDVWTIRFQGEQTGDYALSIQATLPSPADQDDAQHFHFGLPSITPLETTRWSGVWAVEGNADTEITFAATGASETDTLRAPTLASYQPKRRIIGVFEFLGGGTSAAAITLDGIRYPSAAAAAAVVDRLELETLVATSGAIRQRAMIRARTAKDGFFNVHLPPDATLWSLTRDGTPIKPVGSSASGVLRVELPGGRLPSAASTVAVLYEVPDRPWGSAGRQTLMAPTFDPGVPTLQSRWTVRLPEGFDYRGFASPLGLESNATEPHNLLLPQLGRTVWRALQWAYYEPTYRRYQNSGLSDPVFEKSLPGWLTQQPPLSDVFASRRGLSTTAGSIAAASPLAEADLGAPANEETATFGTTFPPPGRAQALTRKLQDIVIPRLDFHATRLTDAIETIRQESRKADAGSPDQFGFSIFLKLPNSATDKQATLFDPRITLTLTRVPVLEALRYVANQAGLKVKIEEYAVSLVPLSESTDALVTQEFRLPPSFIPNDGTTSGRMDAKVFLEASGVTFPPGASATYLAATNRLVVRNTQENIDLITSLTEEASAPPQAQTAARQTRVDLGAPVIDRKLQNIHIPQIEFRRTSLSMALDFLRDESRRLDPDPNPAARGVNIVLKSSPIVAVPGHFPRPEITLHLQQPTLLEALRSVAGQAGLYVKIEPYAVSIVPLSDLKNEQETVEIPVPPSFFAASAGQAGTGAVTIARADAKSLLSDQGINFPPGSAVTYLPGTGRLVVRNTRENIDLLRAVVEAKSNAVTLGGSSVTAGNRTGTYGISANAIDTLLFGDAARAQTSGIYSVAGVFTDPQFQTVVRALNQQPKVAGLLPMRLDLPANGRVYTFAGGGAPGALDFHYVDERTAARWRWIWLTLGALGFLLGAAGWAHPCRRTAVVLLALTFFPLIVAPGSVFACNALLAGWLWAGLAWLVTRLLLRRRCGFLPRAVLPVLVACGAVFPGSSARADEPMPAPAGELVIVPYDAKQPIAAQEAKATYYLPYERFLALWEAAKRHRQPAAPAPPPGEARYTLDTAHYEARLAAEGTLEISGVVDFQTFGEGWVDVPFDFGEVRLGTVTLDGAPAALGENNLWVGQSGAHRATVSLTLPAEHVTAGTNFAWTIPRTTAGVISALIPRQDLQVELLSDAPGSGQVKEIVPAGNRLTATVGGATRIELNFRAAPPAAPPLMLIPLTHVEAQLSAGARQETLRAELRFAFPGGSENSFSVQLDSSLTLTGLDASDVQSWSIEKSGESQWLRVTLNTPARDSYRFSVTAERPATGEGERHFPLVTAMASRVELVTALLATGPVDLALPAGLPTGMRRVNFHPSAGGRPFAAFESGGSNREIPTATALVYSVQAAPDKRSAHINYLYQIGHGKIELAASLRLVPGAVGAPILSTDLRFPPGFTVQAVVGDAVKQWWTDGDRLSLRFQPETGEAVPLVVYLVQSFAQSPAVFALRPLVAEGYAETDGETLVAADRSFKVGLTLPTAGPAARNLTEIDADEAADEFQVRAPLERQRAFRYKGAVFDVPAQLETLPAQWQAQWVTHATVRDGTVAVETHVNVRVLQGAVDTFEFRLSGQAAEGRVSGESVRETFAGPVVANDNAGGRSYRVLLQDLLYGGSETSFTFRVDLPLSSGGQVMLPNFVFPNGSALRDTSDFLLVENVSADEMTLDPHGLDPAVAKDVPFVPAQTAAGTRFFRAAPGTPWTLAIGVTALEKSAGRAALVTYAELTSTLRADGEEWHRAVYRLQNRRLQFLPVDLPPGVELIGARVAGDPVRVDTGPAMEKGQAPTLLIPLLKTRPGELSYDVELVYRRSAPGPGSSREAFFPRWDLADPRLPGVPVEKTLWDVYLPGDARLLSQGGNVEPVVAALSETEKLESALTDLRILSATYLSGNASTEERQRALSNFNRLAGSMTEETSRAALGKSLGISELVKSTPALTSPSALLKKSAIVSQNAMVDQKQAAIRRELDMLNSANNSVPADTRATRGVGTGSFTGRIQYGSPIVMQNRWLDQRAANQSGNGALNQAPVSAAGPAPSQTNLALNDSMSVNLGRTAPTNPFPYPTQFQPPQTLSPPSSQLQQELHLSTARAQGTSAVTSLPTLVLKDGRTAGRDDAPSNIPGLPSPTGATDETASAGEPTVQDGKLRSTGRISLAVNFPLEGQIYHFKKVKDEARLTLMSVSLGRFRRLSFLLTLAAVLTAWWMLRAGWRRFVRKK